MYLVHDFNNIIKIIVVNKIRGIANSLILIVYAGRADFSVLLMH